MNLRYSDQTGQVLRGFETSPQLIESHSVISCGEPDTSSCGLGLAPYDMWCWKRSLASREITSKRDEDIGVAPREK